LKNTKQDFVMKYYCSSWYT